MGTIPFRIFGMIVFASSVVFVMPAEGGHRRSRFLPHQGHIKGFNPCGWNTCRRPVGFHGFRGRRRFLRRARRPLPPRHVRPVLPQPVQPPPVQPPHAQVQPFERIDREIVNSICSAFVDIRQSEIKTMDGMLGALGVTGQPGSRYKNWKAIRADLGVSECKDFPEKEAGKSSAEKGVSTFSLPKPQSKALLQKRFNPGKDRFHQLKKSPDVIFRDLNLQKAGAIQDPIQGDDSGVLAADEGIRSLFEEELVSATTGDKYTIRFTYDQVKTKDGKLLCGFETFIKDQKTGKIIGFGLDDNGNYLPDVPTELAIDKDKNKADGLSPNVRSGPGCFECHSQVSHDYGMPKADEFWGQKPLVQKCGATERRPFVKALQHKNEL